MTDASQQTSEKTVNLRIKSKDDFNVSRCEPIVDFAAKRKSNDELLQQFTKTFSDRYTGRTALGSSIVIGANGGYDFQGVTSSSLNLKAGDTIRSVWFNSSENDITFTPKISFEDPDRRGWGKSGEWHNMSTISIKPNRWNASNYLVSMAVADADADAVELININVNFNNNRALTFGKIEHINPDLSANNVCVIT